VGVDIAYGSICDAIQRYNGNDRNRQGCQFPAGFSHGRGYHTRTHTFMNVSCSPHFPTLTHIHTLSLKYTHLNTHALSHMHTCRCVHRLIHTHIQRLWHI